MAMKLYYGDELVGGEVDLDDFDQLKTDVEGKYDKGDESAIPDGSRDYADAAAMESAVKGNASDIAKIREEVADVLSQLGSENIQVEFGKYFPKYGLGDEDLDSLIYDSAAKMGVLVQRHDQAIIDNGKAITDGDAATLAAANKHSDDNDAVTLDAANKYTDGEIAKIPDAEGIQEVEDQAVRNQNIIDGDTAPAGVMTIAVVDALPNSPSATTLYVVKG